MNYNRTLKKKENKKLIKTKKYYFYPLFKKLKKTRNNLKNWKTKMYTLCTQTGRKTTHNPPASTTIFRKDKTKNMIKKLTFSDKKGPTSPLLKTLVTKRWKKHTFYLNTLRMQLYWNRRKHLSPHLNQLFQNFWNKQ